MDEGDILTLTGDGDGGGVTSRRASLLLRSQNRQRLVCVTVRRDGTRRLLFLKKSRLKHCFKNFAMFSKCAAIFGNLGKSLPSRIGDVPSPSLLRRWTQKMVFGSPPSSLSRGARASFLMHLLLFLLLLLVCVVPCDGFGSLPSRGEREETRTGASKNETVMKPTSPKIKLMSSTRFKF